MRIFLVCCLLFTFFTAAKGQQYPVFSQYYFNELVINPGYAGSQVKRYCDVPQPVG
jgi:hypothetical protein